MFLLRDELTLRLREAIGRAGLEVPPQLVISVIQAADLRFGDYQTNLAMTLAKSLGKNPREIAAQLRDAFQADDLCEKVDIAGPGFLNFRLAAPVYESRLPELLRDKKLLVPAAENPRSIVVDFSAPNVAKPMHVGHIRSTFIGDCLARVARFLGHKVFTDNHIGDWGTQFGMILHGWKTMLNQEALAADPIAELLRLYIAVNQACKAEPELREQCKAELVKLQAGDAENLAIWTQCVRLTMESLEKTVYKPLGIKFDCTFGESFYNDRLPRLVRRLLEKNIAEISEGAACLFFKDDSLLANAPPFIIRKSDGGFGYATTDLATVDYRLEAFNAEEIWYVVGMPQQLHFQQLAAATKRREQSVKIVFVGFGSILGQDGKMFRTRSGDSVELAPLLAEAVERAQLVIQEKNPQMPAETKAEVARAIGFGALKYAELSQNRLTDYKFDWDKMLAFQGNTAPYLIYCYVRIRSIFRKLDGIEINRAAPLKLTEPQEVTLARILCQFGESLHDVLHDHRPNILANYLYELATAFHAFFENCPVLREEDPVRNSRLLLCEATSLVLKQGLDLMGIGTVERM